MSGGSTYRHSLYELSAELEDVQQKRQSYGTSSFLDVCGIARAHFEEIQEDKEEKEAEESCSLPLLNGSRLAPVVKDDALQSISAQIKQVEAECAKSSAKKMQTWTQTKAARLKIGIKESQRRVNAIKASLKAGMQKMSEKDFEALEEELQSAQNILDQEKREFYFPTSSISLGSNGIYLGLDDIFIENICGSFSLHLSPGKKLARISLVLSEIKGGSNNTSRGFLVKIRLLGLKMRCDGSLFSNLSLENVHLEISMNIRLEVVFDIEKQIVSAPIFDVNILHFKGSFGLTKSLVSGVLALAIPIIRHKIINLIPVEVGRVIAELPRDFVVEGKINLNSKVPLDDMQHAIFKCEKICQLMGLTPLQFVLFVGLQKSMERKKIIRSILDFIAYRQKYEKENQWEILKIFWDQAFVLYISGLNKMQPDLVPDKSEMLSFEKLLLGLEEITAHPINIEFSLTKLDGQISFNSLTSNALSVFKRWTETLTPKERSSKSSFFSLFSKLESKLSYVKQKIYTILKLYVSSAAFTLQLSLLGGPEAAMTARLDNVDVHGPLSLYTPIPLDNDFGHIYPVPVMHNIRMLPEGVLNWRLFHLGCQEMFEKNNFDKFKEEYERDPLFAGLQCSSNQFMNHPDEDTQGGARRVGIFQASQSFSSSLSTRTRHCTMSTAVKAAQEEALMKKKACEVVSGWMTKEGHIFKTWHKRWFVLNKGVLRYYKYPISVFPYGQYLKGEISLDKYLAYVDSDDKIILQSLQNGKDFRMEVGEVQDRDKWVDSINLHVKYWHSVQCAGVSYQDVDLAADCFEDEKLLSLQKRMISLHKRQSDYEYAEVENILRKIESENLLMAYKVLDLQVFRPIFQIYAQKPLQVDAGKVLFSAGASDAGDSVGSPLTVRAIDEVGVKFTSSKAQLQVSVPHLLRYITLHLEDEDIFFHTIAMLSGISRDSCCRLHEFLRALVALISKYILLPNFGIFVNISCQCTSSDEDITLSINTPRNDPERNNVDCIKTFLKFSVKEVFEEIKQVKELLLRCGDIQSTMVN